MKEMNKKRFRIFIATYIGAWISLIGLSFVLKGINPAMLIVGPGLLAFMFLLGYEVHVKHKVYNEKN